MESNISHNKYIKNNNILKYHKSAYCLVNRYIDELVNNNISDGNIKIIMYINNYFGDISKIYNENEFRAKFLHDCDYILKIILFYTKLKNVINNVDENKYLMNITEYYIEKIKKLNPFNVGDIKYTHNDIETSKYIKHIIPEIIDYMYDF